MGLPRLRESVAAIRPYVPGKPIEEVQRELGISDVIKLASNENPLGPSPMAVRAVEASISKLHIYPDGNCYVLKRRLAETLGVRESQLIIGNGSDEIVTFVAEAFVNPGEQVVFGYPSFSEYEFAARVAGGVPVPVPLKSFTYDLDAMLDAITPSTRLVFVCNPNNPTGTIVESRQVEEFVEQVPESTIVVFDEAYFEYVESDDYPNTLKWVEEGRNVLILRTFSKIYGLAGLRVGYGIGSTELVSALMRVREPFNVNSIAQAAAAAALSDTEHVRKSRQTNREGKQYLYREFERLGLPYVPSEANFVFVNVGVDSKQLFQALLRLGVIVRTGDIFGEPNYIRVTVGTKPENERFISALENCLSVLDRGGNS